MNNWILLDDIWLLIEDDLNILFTMFFKYYFPKPIQSTNMIYHLIILKITFATWFYNKCLLTTTSGYKLYSTASETYTKLHLIHNQWVKDHKNDTNPKHMGVTLEQEIMSTFALLKPRTLSLGLNSTPKIRWNKSTIFPDFSWCCYQVKYYTILSYKNIGCIRFSQILKLSTSLRDNYIQNLNETVET